METKIDLYLPLQCSCRHAKDHDKPTTPANAAGATSTTANVPNAGTATGGTGFKARTTTNTTRYVVMPLLFKMYGTLMAGGELFRLCFQHPFYTVKSLLYSVVVKCLSCSLLALPKATPESMKVL